MSSSSTIHNDTNNSDKALNDNYQVPKSTGLPIFYDFGSDGEDSCGAGGSSGEENDYGEKIVQRQPRRQRTSPPPLETIIDKAANKTYRQIHLLGEGSFGHVHVAVDEKGEKVALKTFKIFDIRNSDVEREWRACMTIRNHQPHHPNVVAPISCFKDGMIPCLTMELCSNKTLDTLLEARGSLQEHEVRYFGQQLVAGVDYLHSLNLVHGDLKPLNLFLTEELVLKVGDFGQAQDLKEGKEFRNVVGTLGFQAPEVLREERHTNALDVFAIGAILFRMLLGVTYKRSSKTAAGSTKSVKINGSVSPHAMDLLQRTLESDPGSRIAMADLLTHPFLTDGPVPQSVSWDILRTAAPLPTEDDASNLDGAHQVEVIKSQEEEGAKAPEEQTGSHLSDSVKEGEEEDEEETQTQGEAIQTLEVAEHSESVVNPDDVDLDDIFEQVEEGKKGKRAKKVWEDDSEDDSDEKERVKGRKKAKAMQMGAVKEGKAPEDKDGGHGGNQDYWHTYLRR